jgi:zinc D-Ala-D-Ala carboxypeptidase
VDMLTKHFTKQEMACRHCGLCLMRDSFMQRLQGLRDAFGVPIGIKSGYRCPTHNQNVGGAKKSLHIEGRAADIWAQDIDKLYELAKIHFPVAIKGPGFIHVDDGIKREWSYV